MKTPAPSRGLQLQRNQVRGALTGSCAAHIPPMICQRSPLRIHVCVNFRQIPAPLRVPSP
jgi:hypothetical protein